jgi:hypothetical protein
MNDVITWILSPIHKLWMEIVSKEKHLHPIDCKILQMKRELIFRYHLEIIKRDKERKP